MIITDSTLDLIYYPIHFLGVEISNSKLLPNKKSPLPTYFTGYHPYFTFFISSFSPSIPTSPSPQIHPQTPTPAPTHAGHQTHQTTTCVHIPQTPHPNPDSSNIPATSSPQYFATPTNTIVGATICNTINHNPVFTIPLRVVGVLVLASPWAAEKPAPKTLMRKERLKFNVARAERNRPRRRREKQEINVLCCGVGWSR